MSMYCACAIKQNRWTAHVRSRRTGALRMCSQGDEEYCACAERVHCACAIKENRCTAHMQSRRTILAQFFILSRITHSERTKNNWLLHCFIITQKGHLLLCHFIHFIMCSLVLLVCDNVIRWLNRDVCLVPIGQWRVNSAAQ